MFYRSVATLAKLEYNCHKKDNLQLEETKIN